MAADPTDSRSHSNSAWWHKLLIAVFLSTYFFYFSWDALGTHFSADELPVIYYYWHAPWRLLTAQFMLWQFYFRPMTGLFYVPIYLKYGLNPVPYHAVLLILLLLGAAQFYRFAEVLGAGCLPAFFTALIACYHAGLNQLYYNGAFAGDTLCGLFYLTAFVYYARIRASGRILTLAQTALFLLLYICALNSKETAASLPLVILAYEWLYHKAPLRRWKELVPWLRGPGRALLFTVGLNLLYLYSRMVAPNSLRNQPGYRMVFSLRSILNFQKNSLGDLFFSWNNVDWRWVFGIWIVLTWLAWRRNRTVLRFAWFYLLLTPLPIEFIDGRHGPYLYTTLAGWAVFMAVVFSDILREAVAFLAAEPGIRRLGPKVISAILVVLSVYFWGRENHRLKYRYFTDDMTLSPETWDAIQQLHDLNPRIRPGSQVVFLDDPFHNYDMEFIAELSFQDRSVHVRLNRVTPVTPQEIAQADYVFTFENGKLIQNR
ncbi:MAG TPA: hypothetical protein VGH38_33990 [Bryobacteraceae bacterium]|jgi:hypothetical protein